MSLTAILAIVILSCDFLLYFFFRYVYSEKRTTRSRRANSLRHKDHQSQSRTSLTHDNSHQSARASFPDPHTRLRTGYF